MDPNTYVEKKLDVMTGWREHVQLASAHMSVRIISSGILKINDNYCFQ